MFGDLILDSNPTTYEEAVATYATLPLSMGTLEDNYAKSSPVRMQLTPISEVGDIT